MSEVEPLIFKEISVYIDLELISWNGDYDILPMVKQCFNGGGKEGDDCY